MAQLSGTDRQPGRRMGIRLVLGRRGLEALACLRYHSGVFGLTTHLFEDLPRWLVSAMAGIGLDGPWLVLHWISQGDIGCSLISIRGASVHGSGQAG